VTNSTDTDIFTLDDANNTITLGAIQNYRKKYDNKFDVYLDSPVHDFFFQAEDGIRDMAMGCKNRPITDIYVRAIRPRLNTRLATSKYDI